MKKKLKKAQILLIDDSVDQQILLTRLLEANGCEVHCTSNGLEALSLLETIDILPEMILLDLRMPTMDGWDFRSHQIATPRLKDIPVVIMSGEEDLENIQVTTNSVDFLRKPLSISTVIETVKRNLQVH